MSARQSHSACTLCVAPVRYAACVCVLKTRNGTRECAALPDHAARVRCVGSVTSCAASPRESRDVRDAQRSQSSSQNPSSQTHTHTHCTSTYVYRRYHTQKRVHVEEAASLLVPPGPHRADLPAQHTQHEVKHEKRAHYDEGTEIDPRPGVAERVVYLGSSGSDTELVGAADQTQS